MAEWEDGLYNSNDLKDCMLESFKSEKDLCGFLEANIVDFVKDLGYEYDSHKREYAILPWEKRSKGSKRVDLHIITKQGISILIECKHPKFMSELMAGVGQMLSYIQLYELTHKGEAEYILLSSKMCVNIPPVIQRFNLPLKFMVLDKVKLLTWPALRKN